MLKKNHFKLNSNNIKGVYICLVLFLFLASFLSFFVNSQAYTLNDIEIKFQIDPVIESFSLKSINPTNVNIKWNISNDYYRLEIYRRFIDRDYLIAILGNQVNNFTDKVDYGTYYEYYIKLFNRNDDEILISNILNITTPVDLDDLGSPKFTWKEYKEQKYPYFPDDYLNYTIADYEVYNDKNTID